MKGTGNLAVEIDPENAADRLEKASANSQFFDKEQHREVRAILRGFIIMPCVTPRAR